LNQGCKEQPSPCTQITQTHFAQIEHCLSTQRGKVSLSNLSVSNAILYVADHGCKWRGLPERLGNGHTIRTRMNRWSKSGGLDRVFEELQRARIVRIKIEAVSADSTTVKVHPDEAGALKVPVLNPSDSLEVDGSPRFIWLPRMFERLRRPGRRQSKLATARTVGRSCHA